MLKRAENWPFRHIDVWVSTDFESDVINLMSCEKKFLLARSARLYIFLMLTDCTTGDITYVTSVTYVVQSVN